MPTLLGIVASYASDKEVYRWCRALLAVSPHPAGSDAALAARDLTMTLTEAMRYHGAGLRSVPEYQCTPEIYRAAVSSDGSMLRRTPLALHDADLFAAAVASHPEALSLVPPSQRTESLRKRAVEYFGASLEYVPYSLRSKELSMAAGASWGRLRDVPLAL